MNGHPVSMDMPTRYPQSTTRAGAPSPRGRTGRRWRGLRRILLPVLMALAPWTAPGQEGTITTPSGARVEVRHMILGGADFYEYIDAAGRRIKHGRYMYSYRNGVLISYIEYRHGVRHGRFVRRSHRDVTLVEGRYRDGRLHGRVRRYYPDGALQLDAHYRAGELHGPFTRYYSNGQVQEEGTFEAGLREGVFTEYHRDGTRALVARYLAGVLDGPVALYGESGVLLARGTLASERIRGAWSCFADGATNPVRVRTDCDGRQYWACPCP